MKYVVASLLAVVNLVTGIAAQAQSSCSSDGVPAPTALLERFVNADCAACWIAGDTPKAGKGELALDWVVPGSKGDEAPMSAVATPDGLARLEALRLPVPGVTAFPPRQPLTPRSANQRLRVAHGQPFNSYVGVSVEFKPSTRGPWKAWVVLIETLPVGTEGSPVERNLVRTALQVEWAPRANAPMQPLYEARSMALPDGVNPDRLRVAGWVQDASGRVAALAVSRCSPAPPAAR